MIALLILATAATCSSATTQTDMNACAAMDAHVADGRINRQWSATYGVMKKRDASDTSRGGGPGYAPALLAAQRAWLQYRDRQCVVEGLEVSGGSMQPMVIANCRARMTDARTKQLAGLVKSK
ncbi:lysozyme inhibitor LprI family protein [Sphingomonas sp.]|uniref:lysozyme inhibitor LprI family protein n=1 Tax=Sphingomonas sp. TaxID=28214 RepID=UPI0025DB410A|nr:lysozyme inhibitor LprI family protein [Sphingomonas sp.]